MRYAEFTISNYRGIAGPVTVSVEKNSLIPIVGINECGKTTVLQALYCFDFVNDKENEGNHLTNILNLYKTGNKGEPAITATIIANREEIQHFADLHNKAESTKEEEATKRGEAYEPVKIEYNLHAAPRMERIKISRNLVTLAYILPDSEYQHLVPMARELVARLPYILYNDDFMERPPNYVDIPTVRPAEITGWLAIYERLFQTTDKDYSLFNITGSIDERRRDSIIADVESELNKRLVKAWKTFLLGNLGDISVRLSLNDSDLSGCDKKLVIRIIEKIQGRVRIFNVIDRSKGFLWFYNFVMKIEFNPKVIGKRKDTVYFLDEPGSYLHSSAQENLCSKLKEISKEEGNVIYCTHSHHLLNPEYIPLNSILIVEKSKKKTISATPLPLVKPVRENQNAFQPILDALQIPAFTFFHDEKPLLAVEGIYDKYAIECMLNINEDINILPSVNAHSIVRNIQFFIGFVKRYAAIWDNDDEGRKEYNRARKVFGDMESEYFDKLPLKGRENRRMEEMFEPSDLQKIRDLLSLPVEANYKTIIATLYFASKQKRNRIINSLTVETKDNFSVLKKIIEKRIKNNSAN